MNKKLSAPKTNIASVRRILFMFLVAVLAFTSGFLYRDRGGKLGSSVTVNVDRTLPNDQADLDFELFWQVWDTLDNSYFDSNMLSDSERVYGAIKGMVASVGDPYTVFLTPRENEVTQEDLSGNFSGVGIQIGFRGNQLAVIAPLLNSPAEEAGIRAGDIIAGIKDEEKDIERGTVGITLPEAVQVIRGPKGSTITLSLLRDESETPLIVDVVRDTIEVPSVVTTFVGEDENIAHIQVLKFGGETLSEWNKSMIEVLKKEDLKGIVLDVRNNPGGYLQGAIDLGSEFLEHGDVVVIEEQSNGKKNEFKTERIGRLTRDDLVVLVNGGSASASEILAGALRDNIETTLIGETTFGKGTIQEPRQLEGGVGLHITTARWLTPGGTWVNDGGLEPDIVVEDDPETDEDEQLDRAIEYFSVSSQTAGI